MQSKHIPLRMCSGCSEMKPKKELVRIVKSADGTVSVDFTGKLNGRGAYLCHDVACLNKAKKSGRIGKSLGVTISDEVYTSLEEALSHENG